MMTWSLIIFGVIIIFLIIFIPLSRIISSELSLSIKYSFKYITFVVLTPIIVNDLSIVENNNFFLIENYKLYAGIIAIIVALISNNILATISLVMASYLLMSNFINI